MTEMRDSYFCRILAPPNAPLPPLTPKYLTILLTERGGAIVFCRVLAPPNDPPPPDATILNYLRDREGAGITFSRILAPPNALPPPPTPQYLTILMTERGGAIILCRTLPPPPSPDATILNDLNDSERGWGRQYSVRS